MTILPLLDRELRRRARSASGYWVRFGAALAGFFVILSTMTMTYGFAANVSQKGAFAFQSLVATAFVLCCFTAFLTVDQISRERREGTLGLLFLTRVRLLDVLLGNFGAAGIASLCALTAFIPVLVVPLLTGGVTGGEAARNVLALFDTMFLSLAIGLWASAGAREWRSSARAATLLLLVCIFGPLLAHWPGPLSALERADDRQYSAWPEPFWTSIIVVQLESWALLLWAMLRMYFAVRDEVETPEKSIRLPPREDEPPIFELAWHQFKRRKYKPLTDDDAPMDWLLRRQKGAVAIVWAGTLLWFFSTFGFRFLPISATRVIYSYLGVYLAVSIVQGCLFAWVASRFFIDTRRTGELELLMTTPEGARTLVVNQWKRLKKVFFWPIAVFVTFWITMHVFNYFQMKNLGAMNPYQPFYLASLVFYGLNLVAGIVAVIWVGMWFGWSQASHARAIVWTVLLTRGLPEVAGVLSRGFSTRLAPPYVNPWYSSLAWYVPQILVFLYFLWLIRWAKRQFGTALVPPPTKSKSAVGWRLLYHADT